MTVGLDLSYRLLHKALGPSSPGSWYKLHHVSLSQILE